jgi:hypothetical protein
VLREVSKVPKGGRQGLTALRGRRKKMRRWGAALAHVDSIAV